MSAPIRTLLLRKEGLSDMGDTPENDLPRLPWTFFVVEDDRDDADLARRVLEQSPYAGEIVRVASGHELFMTLERRGFFSEEGPGCERCIILLDINLAIENGIALLDALRSHPRTSDMRIIMVTGQTRSGDVEAAYRRHANAFIAKPLRAQHLDEIHAVMRGDATGMKVH